MSVLPFPEPENRWPQPRISIMIEKPLLCAECSSPRIDIFVRPDNSCGFHCYECSVEFNYEIPPTVTLLLDSEAWRFYIENSKSKSLAAELPLPAILRDRAKDRIARATANDD
jgi:hypothetical protein